MLARLLGLLVPVSCDDTPNEMRLLRWLNLRAFDSEGRDGVPDTSLLALLPERFLLLRTVTLAGMLDAKLEPPLGDGTLVVPRGEARGGVLVGAGSLDRAECTRSSSFCILPISPRI